jgi:hypothetical protein
MSITIAFGRWGLPYLVCIGRWEWICVRTADNKPVGRPRWRIERSTGSDEQLSEIVVHCGGAVHCFTRWPRPTPLPPRRPLASEGVDLVPPTV